MDRLWKISFVEKKYLVSANLNKNLVIKDSCRQTIIYHVDMAMKNRFEETKDQKRFYLHDTEYKDLSSVILIAPLL